MSSLLFSLKDCLCRELDNLLKSWNLDYLNNLNLNCEEKLWIILKVLRYWIFPTKYKVFISKELFKKIERGYFHSLKSEKGLYKQNLHIIAFKQLVSYLQEGYNVNAFLSKNNFPPSPSGRKKVKNRISSNG